jgi:hypothetical protein
MRNRIVLAASLLGAFALAGTAFAGNGAGPSKSSSSSISSPVVVSPTASLTATSATTGPRFGDIVTFNVSTTETEYPFVNLTCYQNGNLVLNGWSAFFAGGLGDGTFGLGSPAWTGGAADCTAELEKFSNNRWRVLASTKFHVDA